MNSYWLQLVDWYLYRGQEQWTSDTKESYRFGPQRRAINCVVPIRPVKQSSWPKRIVTSSKTVLLNKKTAFKTHLSVTTRSGTCGSDGREMESRIAWMVDRAPLPAAAPRSVRRASPMWNDPSHPLPALPEDPPLICTNPECRGRQPIVHEPIWQVLAPFPKCEIAEI